MAVANGTTAYQVVRVESQVQSQATLFQLFNYSILNVSIINEGISHRITNEDMALPSSSLSSGVLHHDVGGSYNNHNMDMYDPNSGTHQQHNNNNNNKNINQFYNSRNFYANDDDIPEPLPSPLALITAPSNDTTSTSEAPRHSTSNSTGGAALEWSS